MIFAKKKHEPIPKFWPENNNNKSSPPPQNRNCVENLLFISCLIYQSLEATEIDGGNLQLICSRRLAKESKPFNKREIFTIIFLVVTHVSQNNHR